VARPAHPVLPRVNATRNPGVRRSPVRIGSSPVRAIRHDRAAGGDLIPEVLVAIADRAVEAQSHVVGSEIVQHPVFIVVFGRNDSAGWNRFQSSVGRARGASRVDVVLQARVPALDKGCSVQHRIRQHAPPIREIQHISILGCRIHIPAAGSNIAQQPLLQVAHIDFHRVHQAVGRATVVGHGVVANLAFPVIVEVQRIPVESAQALLRQRGGRECAIHRRGGNPVRPHRATPPVIHQNLRRYHRPLGALVARIMRVTYRSGPSNPTGPR
jgi:hypothetical protein